MTSRRSPSFPPPLLERGEPREAASRTSAAPSLAVRGAVA
jgi:hypothetical protein